MKKILLALILVIGLVGLVNAQAVKLGVVDTDRVLAQSNEAAEISRLFNLDLQNWRSQLRTMDEEVKTMEREFEIESLTRNEAAKREAQARIDAKKAEVGRFIEEYFGEGGRQEQRYRELLEPLTLKVQNIINAIATDENYTMILDTSYGVLLYVLPSLDITDQVILELNRDTVAPTDSDIIPEIPGEPRDPMQNETGLPREEGRD
ncbi:MAG: OmpH family outer membrane protein [Candidatus Cloacimonadota bacterium]